MSDGLNFRITEDPMKYFILADSGMYFPNPQSVDTSVMQEVLKKQLNANIGFHEAASRKAVQTELESDNPAGNTRVISSGLEVFGFPPKQRKRVENRSGIALPPTKEQLSLLETRSRKFYDRHQELIDYTESFKPGPEASDKEIVQWAFERHQIDTGFAFDNNKFGDVTKSALEGIITGIEGSNNTELSDEIQRLIVEECHNLREELLAAGLQPGSLSPYGATLMRGLQDNDGLYVSPVFKHGFDPLDSDAATALLIESNGVASMGSKVGTEVEDLHGKGKRKFAIIDAAAWYLDHVPLEPLRMIPTVTLLERIQKTGVRNEVYHSPWGVDYPFTQKPGKARSVNPLSLIPSVFEGMVFAPFNDICQEKKFLLLPSLQDPSTRRDMVTKMLKEFTREGFDAFDMDISGYDKDFLMCILVTLIQIAVKPFYKQEYHRAIDLVCFIHTYKQVMIKTQYVKMFPELAKRLQELTSSWEHGGFTFYFTWASWMSGIKATHVGGSLYGRVTLHGVLPQLVCKELGIKYDKPTYPVPGIQAGDDFLGHLARRIMNETGMSLEEVYEVISRVCEKLNHKFNASKMWVFVHSGEKASIFLQDLYHLKAECYGVGSAGRGAASWDIVERDKHLPVNEQEIQVISKMAQGYNSLYCDRYVRFVLERDHFLAYLFKEYGLEAFRILCGSKGKQEMEELANRVGVDSYHWGTTKEQFCAGNLPILESFARVAGEIEVSINDIPQVAEDYLSGLDIASLRKNASSEQQSDDEAV